MNIFKPDGLSDCGFGTENRKPGTIGIIPTGFGMPGTMNPGNPLFNLNKAMIEKKIAEQNQSISEKAISVDNQKIMLFAGVAIFAAIFFLRRRS